MMTSDIHRKRLARCRSLMQQMGFEALLLTKPANMYYLTGNSRLCSYAMVTRRGEVALGVPQTDLSDVKELANFDRLVGFDNEIGMIHSIAQNFQHFGIDAGLLGLEHTYLTGAMTGMLTHPHAKPAGLAPGDCTPLLAALRIVKEGGEVERIWRACHVAEIGMEAAIQAGKAGVTESELAGVAEQAMRQAGAEDFYRSYVSSGRRTNLAHGLPTLRRLEAGDLVMIDLHPIVEGYSGDMCRTICLGKPAAEQQAAFDLFVKVQQDTISAIRAGARMADLEQHLHEALQNAGHGDHIFGPPIHGVGIEFEEPPLPPGHAFFHGEKEPGPLEPNMVLAVGNCGLYTGPWGIRVEDTVLVGPTKAEPLTNYPRFLTR